MAYKMSDARIDLNNVNKELERLGGEPLRLQRYGDGGRGAYRLMQSKDGIEFEVSYRMTPDQLTRALDLMDNVLRKL